MVSLTRALFRLSFSGKFRRYDAFANHLAGDHALDGTNLEVENVQSATLVNLIPIQIACAPLSGHIVEPPLLSSLNPSRR